MTDKENEVPSIRDALEGAFAADEAGTLEAAPIDNTPVEDLAEPAAPAPTPAAPAEPAAPVEPAAPAAPGEPQRDAQGRFVKQDPAAPAAPAAIPDPAAAQPAAQQPATAPTPTADPATPAAPVDAGGVTADAGSLAPPPGWSVQAKAAFDALPAEVKQAVAHREVEIDKGFEKLTHLKGLDNHIAHSDRLGIGFPVHVDKLFAAEQYVERNPVEGIKWMMQQYGVSPEQIGSSAQPQPTAPAPAQNGVQPAAPQPVAPQAPTAPQPAPAAIQPVMQEIAAVKTQLETFQHQQEQARVTEATNEINAFMANPANKYAANLRNEMSQLIGSGLAVGLQDAYEKALWMNPDTKAIMLAEQANGLTDEQKAEAEAKRLASAQVSGASPDAGATPQTPGASPGTVRGAIVDAMNSQRI